MEFSLKNIHGLSQVYISHVHNGIENKFFYKIYKSSFGQQFAKQITPISFILFYNGSLVTRKVIRLTAGMFKPCIHFVPSFMFSYAQNMVILMSCMTLLVTCIIFYIIVNTLKLKICTQIAGRCEPWKFLNGA
jgi:hypothetical protein